MIGVQTGAGLGGHADFDELFRHWLLGDSELGAATAELQAFLTAPPRPPQIGEIWRDPVWRDGWLGDLQRDLPTDEDRAQVEQAVNSLAAGKAEVVITGQQPGFLGGPLYTLYKIATCVVLAELRSAAGYPTVPVFWAAGDDDDIREALQPVAWDPPRRVLLHHADHGRRGLSADRMVGAVPAREIAAGGAAWLAEHAGRNDLARDLAAIWQHSIADDLSWGRLQRRALLRVFSGRGLLVVGGDDAAMHAAAAPFYRELWERRDELRGEARRGGQLLVSAGHTTALGDPSIQRFLHLGRDGRRRPLAADHAGALPPASDLRPGVVVRSPIQDWLWRPAGVVVGPGEVAYLKQLAPVYEMFGLPRAPLLPRLFAQLGTEGHGEFRSWAMELADRHETARGGGHAKAADRVVDSARAELRQYLRADLDLPPGRADDLTRQVSSRWSRYLQGVLQREQQRRRDGAGADQPVWLRPDGRRQERSLAGMAAAALWGDEFSGALAHASRRHIDAGLDGDWREFLLTVPEP